MCSKNAAAQLTKLQEMEVVGLLTEPSFHMAAHAAETLRRNFPSKIAVPKVLPLLQFAWNEYLQEKKKELRGETWEYPSNVMCFVDGQLLGDEKMLLKWAYDVWDYKDFKPTALYEAITSDFLTKYLKGKKGLVSLSWQHMFVFMEIAVQEVSIGKLLFEGVILGVGSTTKKHWNMDGNWRMAVHQNYLGDNTELYSDTCPRTCQNFQCLCTGEKGNSESGLALTYKDSIFHRIVKNGWIQGGDIKGGRGNGGESIYGPVFEDENFVVPHDRRGVLGMVNKGRHTNGSQFYVTLQPAPYLNTKYVAFGQVIEGSEVLRELELTDTSNERPVLQCKIINCNIFQP